jgi:hypothetical protein
MTPFDLLAEDLPDIVSGLTEVSNKSAARRMPVKQGRQLSRVSGCI